MRTVKTVFVCGSVLWGVQGVLADGQLHGSIGPDDVTMSDQVPSVTFDKLDGASLNFQKNQYIRADSYSISFSNGGKRTDNLRNLNSVDCYFILKDSGNGDYHKDRTLAVGRKIVLKNPKISKFVDSPPYQNQEETRLLFAVEGDPSISEFGCEGKRAPVGKSTLSIKDVEGALGSTIGIQTPILATKPDSDGRS